MHRNWSRQLKLRTLKSPRYFLTSRRKVCHGANSITWAKTSLPAYIRGPGVNPGSLPQFAFATQVVNTLTVAKSPRQPPGALTQRNNWNCLDLIGASAHREYEHPPRPAYPLSAGSFSA